MSNVTEYIVSIKAPAPIGVVQEKFLGPRDPVEARKVAEFLQSQKRLLNGVVLDLHPADQSSTLDKLAAAVHDQKLNSAICAAVGFDIAERHSSWGQRLRLRVTADGKIVEKPTPFVGDDFQVEASKFDPSIKKRAKDFFMPEQPKHYFHVDCSVLPDAAAEAIAPWCDPRKNPRGIRAVFLVGEFDRKYPGRASGTFTVILDEWGGENAKRDFDNYTLFCAMKRLLFASPAIVQTIRDRGSVLPERVHDAARGILKSPRPAKDKLPPLPGEPGYTVPAIA